MKRVNPFCISDAAESEAPNKGLISSSRYASLLMGLGSLDREAQLPLRCAEVILGFGAVALHVVVIRRTCMLHLMDGLNNMLVNIVKIVPIVGLCR